MSTEAFERVRHQVGACGIACGSCAVGNGAIAHLAARLGSQLTAYDAPDWVSIGTEWGPFLAALTSLETLGCPGCARGGGRENCELRACAREKGIGHCTTCAAFPACANGALLDSMRSGALRVGLAVLAPGEDPRDLLQRLPPER